MKMLVMNRKITVSILVMIVLVCGLGGVSYAADPPAVELQVETEQALTEGNSKNFVVTLLLEGAAWAETSKIRSAVSVSGIDGVKIQREQYRSGTDTVWVCTADCGQFIEWGYWKSIPTYGYRPAIKRKSTTVLEVPLTFDGDNFDFGTDAALTFTVKASAIVDYDDASLTAITPLITVVSAPSPLTEQNLGVNVVSFTITGGRYAARLPDGAVTVAGIAGVDVSDVVRKSDTVLEVPLAFDGTDFDTDATLTFTVSPEVIANDNSVPITAKIPVTAIIESVSASATPALRETTLNGSVVSLTLTGLTYEPDIAKIRDALTVSGITGVTIDTATVKRLSNTEITVELGFDTDFDTDTALIFSVGAGGLADYTGEAFTAEISATATKEVLSASVVSPLTEATLHGSTVELTITGATFEEDIAKIRDAVTVTGITGVTIDTATAQRLNERKITFELDYDGTDLIRDTTLTFTITSEGIANHNGEVTTEIPVTANRNEDVLFIFFTDVGTDTIQRAHLDMANSDVSNREDLVTQGLSGPAGIALDVAGGKMYWTDRDTGKIQRANLDGSNIEDLVTEGLERPEGIALDVAGGKMYWTDRDTGKIQRANLDGSNIEDLVTRGLDDPNGIALDVAGGKMYWTDDGTDKIQRANLDGSNIKNLVTSAYNTFGIALDVAGGKMYWTRWYYLDGRPTGEIQRANLDGSNVEDLVPVTEGLGVLRSIALDVVDRKMYWTDRGTDKIQRANLDGSNIEDLLTEGLESPSDLAIVMRSLVDPTTEEPTVAKEDVNRDGVVDVNDLAYVGLQYGQTGVNIADVNGDGVVNVDDLILVAAAVDAAVAAAPAARAKVQTHFTETQLQGWLTEARESGNTSRVYQRGIAVLQQLLTLFTPEKTALLANYPNPFNPETWIPYQLSEPTNVRLTLYDINGRVVRDLDLGHQRAGKYESRSRAAYWDGRNAIGEPVASGLYFYTLTAGDFTATRKMLILK